MSSAINQIEMTKIENNIEKTIFDAFLEKAKLEIISDIHFGYRYEDANTVIDFYQDSVGKNHLPEFLVKHSGLWFSMTASGYQLKAMFNKLNDTIIADKIDYNPKPIANLYDYFGVQPSNFY
jgi:hypothetical protein